MVEDVGVITSVAGDVVGIAFLVVAVGEEGGDRGWGEGLRV